MEAISPNFTGCQSGVRRYEVAEFLDFDFQALFLGNLLYIFHDDGMRAGVNAYNNGLIHIHLLLCLFIATAASCYQRKGC